MPLSSSFLFILVGTMALVGCGNPRTSNALRASDAGILGGRPVSISHDSAALSLAALELEISEMSDGQVLQNTSSFCTATLIARDLLLTGAHCLIPEKPVAGTRFLIRGRAVFPQAGVSIPIKNSIAHPDYDSGRTKNLAGGIVTDPIADVGLVLLENAVPDSLSIATLADQPLKEGLEIATRIYGFGSSSAPNTFLETRVAGTRMEDLMMVPKIGVPRRHQIHYDQSDGQGFCYGDSGGPHFLQRGGKPVLVALSSQLTELSMADPDWCRRKSIAVQIFPVLSWIRQAEQELREAR